MTCLLQTAYSKCVSKKYDHARTTAFFCCSSEMGQSKQSATQHHSMHGFILLFSLFEKYVWVQRRRSSEVACADFVMMRAPCETDAPFPKEKKVQYECMACADSCRFVFSVVCERDRPIQRRQYISYVSVSLTSHAPSHPDVRCGRERPQRSHTIFVSASASFWQMAMLYWILEQ